MADIQLYDATLRDGMGGGGMSLTADEKLRVVHFFDGFALDAGYALDCLRAAAEAGAERVVLCDTNGGSLPPQVRTAFAVVREALPDVPLGIHTHDDSGCGVANTLVAVEAGATQ